MKIISVITFFYILSGLSSYSNSASDTQNGNNNYCGIAAEAQLQNGDRFGGSIRQLQNGSADGLWWHRTPKGDNFSIKKVDWIILPDNNSAESKERSGEKIYKFGGRGTWNNTEGYSFRVVSASDFKNNDREQYSIFIFGPDGKFIYSAAGYVTDGSAKRIGSYCPSPDLDF